MDMCSLASDIWPGWVVPCTFVVSCNAGSVWNNNTANFQSGSSRNFLFNMRGIPLNLWQIVRICKENQFILWIISAKERSFNEGEEEEINCIGELIDKLLESFSIFGNEKSVFVGIFFTIIQVIDRLLCSKNVLIQCKGLLLLYDILVIQPLDLSSSASNLTILCQFSTLRVRQTAHQQY